MMRFCLFILLCICSLNLSSQTKSREIKSLRYTGYYNWGFLWVKAGEVKFTQEPSKKYPNATMLKATGSTIPARDWIFKIRDTLVSHFDKDTFYPYEFTRAAHEGKYHKRFEYWFDYKNQNIYSRINKIGKYIRRDTIRMLPDTYDMLSVAWKARNIDFSKYAENDTIPIRILLDDKIYNLYVRFLGRDEVRIRREIYKCYVFSPLLVEGEVFEGGEAMKIWVTTDNSRIPVMVESKIIVGSVKGILDPESVRFYN